MTFPCSRKGRTCTALILACFFAVPFRKSVSFSQMLSPQKIHGRTLFPPCLLLADDKELSQQEVMVPDSTGPEMAAYQYETILAVVRPLDDCFIHIFSFVQIPSYLQARKFKFLLFGLCSNARIGLEMKACPNRLRIFC